MKQKAKVLFLCTGNSCRSQMAEGWARFLKATSIEAYSAGTNPQGLNQYAVLVMKEVGVDISNQTSKHLEEMKKIQFDLVVTVCDDVYETCPYFPGNHQTLHVGFEDPPRIAKTLQENGATLEEQLDSYRKVRDEIKAFVESLQIPLEESKNE
jgi:arsenate reductase